MLNLDDEQNLDLARTQNGLCFASYGVLCNVYVTSCMKIMESYSRI